MTDNGAAYRANTLQGVCAPLGIHRIFCRPYAPEGKGKLERWHRTCRDQFLSELDARRITDLADLNARLWAVEIHSFLEQIFDLFEARYGDQITRFYDSMSRDNLVGYDGDPQPGDPPF